MRILLVLVLVSSFACAEFVSAEEEDKGWFSSNNTIKEDTVRELLVLVNNSFKYRLASEEFFAKLQQILEVLEGIKVHGDEKAALNQVIADIKNYIEIVASTGLGNS